jgi:hypothetical protein
MPIDPSVMIQVFSALALRLAAIRASALLGRDCSGATVAALALSLLKLPERKTLNFFSILLAGRRKITRRQAAASARLVWGLPTRNGFHSPAALSPPAKRKVRNAARAA